MDILEEFPEESGDTLWPTAETYWITMFKFWGFRLCNHDSGGNSGYKKSETSKAKARLAMLGRKHSAETIEKIRIAKSNPSEETRRRLSAAFTGRVHSPETREKMRQSRTGYVPSAKTCSKISEAKMGHEVSEEARAKIKAARALQVFSEESKKKMGAVHKGKPKSLETIARMRLAQQARQKRNREVLAAVSTQ